jgi:hypothetical protein
LCVARKNKLQQTRKAGHENEEEGKEKKRRKIARKWRDFFSDGHAYLRCGQVEKKIHRVY